MYACYFFITFNIFNIGRLISVPTLSLFFCEIQKSIGGSTAVKTFIPPSAQMHLPVPALADASKMWKCETKSEPLSSSTTKSAGELRDILYV